MRKKRQWWKAWMCCAEVAATGRGPGEFAGEGEKLLENAITRLGLSARAHDRIMPDAGPLLLA